MKKILILISILFISSLSFADNTLSLSSASGHPGDTVEISLSLANTDNVVAVQMDIPLGNSLTYVANSCTHTSRANGHQLTASVVNGTLKIITYSLSLNPYSGNSGEILTFKLKLGNNPGTIALEPSQSVASAANGDALESSVNNGSVTILTPEIQVNTPTIDFGHIPIRSTYNNNVSLTNTGNEPLVISAVQFSNDRFSSSFSGMTIQSGASGSIPIEYAPIDEGAVNERLTIVSNSTTGNAIVNLIADPFAVNELHVVQVSGYSDSTVTVALTMNNMSEISGLQCKFKLPSALEYVDGSFALSGRSNGHQVWSGMSNDTLTIVAFSLSNAVFADNDGTIATFRVKLVGTSGWYWLEQIEPILSNVAGVNKLSASYGEYVIIRSPLISCDNTLDMGSSSVTETVVKPFAVNNYGDAPLRIDEVVFDQIGFSVQNELPMVIEQYQSAVLNVAYNREMEGNFSANMQIRSNDPTNGAFNVTVSGSRYEPNCVSITTEVNTYYEDVQVALNMDNYTEITAVQFDFCYPHRYYSVGQTDFVAGSRINGHSLTVFPLNDSVYRVMLFSMQNVVFGGHMGGIVSVTMHPLPATVAGTYSVFGENIVLSDIGGVNKFSCDNPSAEFTTICPPLAESVEATACDSYAWNGETYTESGDYEQTFTASNGCDSVVTLHLTINHSLAELFEVTICESYQWNNETYTESGSYQQTFTAANGCDSVVTLRLTINHSNTGVFEHTACDSYEWIDGNTYTESTNTPTFTLQNAAGCDSVVTLHLTINHSNTGVFEHTACDSYEWIDGNTYTESTNTPTFTLQNAAGCDSVVTLHLTINHSNAGVLEYTACDSFEWIDGVTYTESTNTPTFTLQNS